MIQRLVCCRHFLLSTAILCTIPFLLIPVDGQLIRSYGPETGHKTLLSRELPFYGSIANLFEQLENGTIRLIWHPFIDEYEVIGELSISQPNTTQLGIHFQEIVHSQSGDSTTLPYLDTLIGYSDSAKRLKQDRGISFSATYAAVWTWTRDIIGTESDSVFQVIMLSDGNNTFVMFNYHLLPNASTNVAPTVAVIYGGKPIILSTRRTITTFNHHIIEFFSFLSSEIMCNTDNRFYCIKGEPLDHTLRNMPDHKMMVSFRELLYMENYLYYRIDYGITCVADDSVVRDETLHPDSMMKLLTTEHKRFLLDIDSYFEEQYCCNLWKRVVALNYTITSNTQCLFPNASLPLRPDLTTENPSPLPSFLVIPSEASAVSSVALTSSEHISPTKFIDVTTQPLLSFTLQSSRFTKPPSADTPSSSPMETTTSLVPFDDRQSENPEEDITAEKAIFIGIVVGSAVVLVVLIVAVVILGMYIRKTKRSEKYTVNE